MSSNHKYCLALTKEIHNLLLSDRSDEKIDKTVEKPNINTTEYCNGRTFLMEALLRNYPTELFEKIVVWGNGLNVNFGITDNNLDRAIDYACPNYPDDIETPDDKDNKCRKDVIKLLIKYNYDNIKPNISRPNYCKYVENVINEMLLDSVVTNNDAAAECLLDIGANANYMNKDNESLLMVALKGNCGYCMFKCLINCRADVNYTNEFGSVIDYVNPLFPKDIKDDFDLKHSMINLLIFSGAKPKLGGEHLRPKFHDYIEKHRVKVLSDELLQACKRNDYTEVKRLIKLGADTKYQDRCGSTPIGNVLYGNERNFHYSLIKLYSKMEQIQTF
jgi:hypothetical protein